MKFFKKRQWETPKEIDGFKLFLLLKKPLDKYKAVRYHR